MNDIATDPAAAPATYPPGAVSWFEVGTPDPAGAQAFYGQLFGWSFAHQDIGVPYVDITTGDGHVLRGGIADTSGQSPAYAAFCVSVDDVAATLERATALGGTVVLGPLDLPTGMAVGYLRDRDGNLVGLFTPPS